jgi:signal transduction histidine kinase
LRLLGEELSACRDLDAVLSLATRLVRAHLGFGNVRIVLGREPDGPFLSHRALRDRPDLAGFAADLHDLSIGAQQFSFQRQDDDHAHITVALRRALQLIGLLIIEEVPANLDPGQILVDTLVGAAQQISVALEHSLLRATESQMRLRSEALVHTCQVLQCSLDLQEIMQVVAHEACRALQAHTCALYLYDAAAEQRVATFLESVPEAEPAWQSTRAAWQHDVALTEAERRVVAQKTPLVLDAAASAQRSPVASHFSWTAQLLVPLLVEREQRQTVVGTLTVYFLGKSADVLDPEDLELAAVLATQAATAIERARLYAAERDRTSRIEEVDRVRREFLATVTHELRTPLTGIIGYTETLTEFWRQMSEERRQHSLEQILASAQRLDRLVRDLLLVTRIEDVRLSVLPAPVKLATAIRQAVGEVRAKYPRQQLHIEKIPPDLTVNADPQRIAQVLVNLIDNAVKYSPEGSSVEIGARQVGERVRVWIRDHGPGLTEDQIGRLFQRFGKLGHVARSGQVGTGLGLYISRHLARAMGGDILVESVPGAGATFTIELALAAQPVAPAS